MNGTQAYDAPPAYRSFSAMAIVAFVLALVCGLFALGGLWWTEVPAALLGFFACAGTGPAGKRGRGLAVAATVIAVLGGGVGFWIQRMTATAFEQAFLPFAQGLAADDRAELARWAPEEDPKPDVATWARRMDSAKQELGKFTGRIEFGNVFWGIYAAMLMVPAHGDEYEPKGDAQVRLFEAIWFRAGFEKGDAWVSLSVGKKDSMPGEGLKEFGKAFTKEPPRFVRDVRIFRAGASSN